ncbi:MULTISPECIES: hypothetical protein [Pseudomonas]|uniref:hypothetical protein n=1 Tax=Pseudomonas TaxID=286 RepID=UPI0007099005|nr:MULTISPECIES: hypothetical protein [Pseudomonas]KQW19865.1 hypothetical protein ASC85_08435 [Pseudomonas sp. Root401]WHS57452.1 hypothetical protein QLH64_31015 [Pseudomonas brassicacearum]WNZ87466.1 hypothetical protein QOM10_29730 [Pseudomonas sp. P108]
MSNNPASDFPRNYSQLPQHAKTMIAALVGAVIGSAACLHTYYNLLGGAEQNQRAAQIETTVEHNRQVVEQTLAVLTRIEASITDRAAQGGNALSKKPTQREINDAIDGLFEKIDDGSAPAKNDASAETQAHDQNAAHAEASADDGSDAKSGENASATPSEASAG